MKSYYLGVDGGGSKCRATLSTCDGQIVGQGLGGPANPFQSISRAIASIECATTEALATAGLREADTSKLIAGVGLAGVNLPSFYQLVNEWEHPFRYMFLTTDLEIACIGAHDGNDGAVIVAGTGSCGFSVVNGQNHICGAHGFPFGDKGSGAWLGLEAVKAVLLAADDLGPTTALTDLVSEQLDANGVTIIERMAGGGSRRFAELAAVIFDAAESGDEVAVGIVKSGATYLSAVAKKLWLTEPPRMSLLGGLRDRILPWMDDDIADAMSPTLYQPDIGALLFAHRAYNQQLDEKIELMPLRIDQSGAA